MSSGPVAKYWLFHPIPAPPLSYILWVPSTWSWHLLCSSCQWWHIHNTSAPRIHTSQVSQLVSDLTKFVKNKSDKPIKNSLDVSLYMTIFVYCSHVKYLGWMSRNMQKICCSIGLQASFRGHENKLLLKSTFSTDIVQNFLSRRLLASFAWTYAKILIFFFLYWDHVFN